MAERERELRVVQVEYVCDDCGRGTMEFSHVRNSYDKSSVHVCTECGAVAYMDCDVRYPRQRYCLPLAQSGYPEGGPAGDTR